MDLRPTKTSSAKDVRSAIKQSHVRDVTEMVARSATGRTSQHGSYLVTLGNDRRLRISKATFQTLQRDIDISRAAYRVERGEEQRQNAQADYDREGARMSPIFVFGPRGCGKTRNAAWIAETFGRTVRDVVDEWEPGDAVKAGAIHLCITPPMLRTAICVPFERLGQAQPDWLPQHIPFGCGTGHVRAMAMLNYIDRMIERPHYELLRDSMIDRIEGYLDEAGVTAALKIIGHKPTAADDLDDEVPF